MSRVCELTGRSKQSGHNVSHSQIKTKRTWKPNLQSKTYVIPQLGKKVKLTISAKAIRLISRYGGISEALLRAKDDHMSPRLRKLRKELQAQAK